MAEPHPPSTGLHPKNERIAWALAAVAGAALLALGVTDWLFYQSFLLSLVWR